MNYTTEETEDGRTVTTVQDLELQYDGDASPERAIDRVNKTLQQAPFALHGQLLVNSSDEKRFKVGDKVRLKSGGPKMTIYSLDEYSVDCMWYDFNTHRYSTREFSRQIVQHYVDTTEE